VERVIHDALARFHFGEPTPKDPQGSLWLPPKEPGTTHGERRPLIGVSGLVGWLIGHYAARSVRALVNL
jgi:hypothetical protein